MYPVLQNTWDQKSKRAISRLNNQKFSDPPPRGSAFFLAVLAVQTAKPATKAGGPTSL